jgi:RNA polymerase sigma factor (sigma-70 family)
MNLTAKRKPFFFDPTGDHAIVLAARSGDQEAFAILVKRHTPKIFAVALRYARVREDAEDIVQETFQNAFLHLNKFEGKSAFLTWLTRIAINQALMLMRRRCSRRETSMDTSNSEEIAASLLDMRDPRPDQSDPMWSGCHVVTSIPERGRRANGRGRPWRNSRDPSARQSKSKPSQKGQFSFAVFHDAKLVSLTA